MTTQIDHKEARRHLDVVRHGGGMTWMSDLDPLDIVEGLLDAYDDDISGFFTQEQVDEAIEEAKDLQKDELDKDHQKEIQRLKEEISELRAKIRGEATSPLTLEPMPFPTPMPLDSRIELEAAVDLAESPTIRPSEATKRPKRPIGKLGTPRRAREPRARPSREPRAAAAPSSTGTLVVVLAVLAEAGIGVALSVNDIVARAGERLPTKSKTPSTVVSRDLALDVKRHGKASKFRRASAGIFRLAMAHELLDSGS